jgi:twitching motility two-component system response regulator PilG
MDIVMPKMDGYEAVSIIRMNPYFKTTPIVMMSSKGGVFDVAKAKLLGFTSSILKPLKSEILEAAIVEYVGESLSE